MRKLTVVVNLLIVFFAPLLLLYFFEVRSELDQPAVGFELRSTLWKSLGIFMSSYFALNIFAQILTLKRFSELGERVSKPKFRRWSIVAIVLSVLHVVAGFGYYHDEVSYDDIGNLIVLITTTVGSAVLALLKVYSMGRSETRSVALGVQRL